ncbi:MAG: prenyltransferase/squalene oxidase repeat-containing protein [Pirellulaceae bacterium]
MPTVTDSPSPHDAAWLASLEEAWQLAYATLHSERTSNGHWTGELSASALSTATAISALAQSRRSDCAPAERLGEVDMAIEAGCDWLREQQNDDGGFGDTDRSYSNIATSLLVLSAWELAKQVGVGVRGDVQGVANAAGQADGSSHQSAAWEYVQRNGAWEGLRRRYGKDKTFVVPILSNCALAGMVDWREVPALPFEAAWLPQELYRWARMPVVSYAVPALVAIGQARFHFAPPRNPLLKAIRRRAIVPTLGVLRSMQPASGGYLEATPLTSFVLMNLAAAGNGNLPVAQDCLRFILDARQTDGSWPIDTNLATWITSLSLNALAQRGPLKLSVGTQVLTTRSVEPHCAQRGPLQLTDSPTCSPAVEPKRSVISSRTISSRTVRWLLACQHRRRHAFTGANPGGWGWTDLSGAVPDADDTPAALLALSRIDWREPQWQRLEQQSLDAVALGLAWLLRLQNRDGGWPTFCRGWGTLPFDRSGTDLTAHALRALHTWLPRLEQVNAASGARPLRAARIQASMRRGLIYLTRMQQADGSWLPLWFGNQDRLDEDNPVYGTGRVLLAYGALGLLDSEQARRATNYLLQSQNPDGGWGGGCGVQYQGKDGDSSSSIEETSIAVEGLLCGGQKLGDASIMHALEWLTQTIRSGNLLCSSPIGFYFAKLWYYERLYPTVFSLGALGAALHASQRASQHVVGTEPTNANQE